MTEVERLRKAKGLRLVQLARLVGVWDCDLTLVEHRDRKPWPRLRKALAEALDVTEAALFTAQGWPREEDDL